MDISNDFVRRELDAIARHHDVAMKLQSEALTRMVETNDLSADEKDQFVTGGLGRRKFLRFGGIAVATSAVFAACGSSSKPATTASGTAAGTAAGTTPAGTAAAGTVAPGSGSGSSSGSTDVTILRTASSVEALAVQTYQKAIASGLITTAAVAAAAKNFMEQHQQHAMAFQSATTKAGGTPFIVPNPVVSAQVVAPALAKLKTQADVLALAYMLESAASQTYQSAIGAFSSGPNASTYNSATAAVLGVESRHQALLGIVLADATMYPPYPANGFQADTGAVKAGTGV